MTTTPENPRGQPGPADGAELVDWALIRELSAFLLVRAPRRHKLLAVTCFLAVVALTVAALLALPRRWEVQASILAQRNPLSLAYTPYGDTPHAAREFVLRRDNIRSLLEATDFVNRHVAARSPAARARDWLNRKLSGREPTPEQRLEDVIDGVQARLWVQVSNEGRITFGFLWSDRRLAYDLVAAALQNFIDARHATEVASIGEAISILEAHATTAQRDIAAATQRLEDKERGLRNLEGPKPRPARSRVAPDLELAKLDARLTARRRALARLEEVRERRVAELRAELLQLENVYADAHPIVIATRRNIETLAQPSPENDTLRAQIADLEQQIKGRGSRPGDATAFFDEEIAEARLRLEEDDPRLEQERLDLRLAFRHYSSLLVQIAEVRVAQDTAREGFKYRYSVIMPPQLPKGPVQPNVPRIVLMGLVGGACFALFASAVADLRSGVLIERWQIERGLGVPVLGELGARSPRA